MSTAFQVSCRFIARSAHDQVGRLQIMKLPWKLQRTTIGLFDNVSWNKMSAKSKVISFHWQATTGHDQQSLPTTIKLNFGNDTPLSIYRSEGTLDINKLYILYQIKIIKADHRSKRQKVNFFNASFYFHISPFTLTFTCKFIFLSIYTITKSHQSLTANSAILTRSLPMKRYVI